jgi:hypothetical protein
MAKYLLIAGSEPFTGKSSTILGIAHQLKHKGIKVGYGKPIGTCFTDSDSVKDEQDLKFITETLELSENQIKSPFLLLNQKTITNYLSNSINYQEQLADYCAGIEAELVLLEGAGDLTQGNLFQLSTPEIANKVNASVLLVIKHNPLLIIDQILSAQQILGDHLIGVLVNSIPI